MKALFRWLDARFPLSRFWQNYFSGYYVPKNLNFLYFFGSLALVVFANQLITGLWLAMFYTPTSELAFASIQSIMRDVHFGWLLRYMHTTGASAFFIIIYVHIFRGILYGSYQNPRELVWILGLILYALLLAEAFLGYLLPWGQMSYWGAEVLTSLLSTIPYWGEQLVTWLRGDYSVSTVTLQRFYAWHIMGMPLLTCLLVYLHMVALRQVGSNNPEGIEISKTLDVNGKPLDGVPFHPYYTTKDFFAFSVFLTLFFIVVFFLPTMNGYFIEAINSVPADPLNTPDHINPLWYMAPFYAILRAIPNKSFGIFLMIIALLLPFLLPWLDRSPVRSMRYKGFGSRISLWLFVLSFCTLGYLGTKPLTPWTLIGSRVSIIFYFGYFLLMPLYTQKEKYSEVPARIVL